MHQEGFSILLPRNRVELSHANTLVLPENDNIASQLVSLSMRRSVLMLIASCLVDQRSSLKEFFENTLYWYQTREKNPAKLETILRTANNAIDRLLKSQLIEQNDDTLLPTPLGKATSRSGLLPGTAANFVKLLKEHGDELEQKLEEFLPAILYWVCSSEKFVGNTPSRFPGYPTKNVVRLVVISFDEKTLSATGQIEYSTKPVCSRFDSLC